MCECGGGGGRKTGRSLFGVGERKCRGEEVVSLFTTGLRGSPVCCVTLCENFGARGRGKGVGGVGIAMTSVAALGISTVMGTTGYSLLNNNNMSKTVRQTTNPTLLTRYGALNNYPAKRDGVASTCGLPYEGIVRAMKPM